MRANARSRSATVFCWTSRAGSAMGAWCRSVISCRRWRSPQHRSVQAIRSAFILFACPTPGDTARARLNPGAAERRSQENGTGGERNGASPEGPAPCERATDARTVRVRVIRVIRGLEPHLDARAAPGARPCRRASTTGSTASPRSCRRRRCRASCSGCRTADGSAG